MGSQGMVVRALRAKMQRATVNGYEGAGNNTGVLVVLPVAVSLTGKNTLVQNY
jgi:hypothetical protein